AARSARPPRAGRERAADPVAGAWLGAVVGEDDDPASDVPPPQPPRTRPAITTRAPPRIAVTCPAPRLSRSPPRNVGPPPPATARPLRPGRLRRLGGT